MDWIKWMLKTFMMLFIALSVCHAQESWIVHAAMGQDVLIPCGIQVKGPSKRLVWKLGDVNNPDNLAHSVGEHVDCDTRKKPNCFLWSNGSLELQNVLETDSGDYFCERDNDTFYSQHTLVVHPEVAFETCSSSEDIFVTQTGPDDRVLAYTNPVCKNTNFIGIVTCDPPSGAKIGMNFTKIVCTCTHSGKVVDTCETPIPESASASGSKAVSIFCALVTTLGIVLGISIGAVLGVSGTKVIAILKKKYCRKQRKDEESNSESHRLVDTNLKNSNSPLADSLPGVRMDSGLPCTNPKESGNTEVVTPDSDFETNTQHSKPCCTEISEFVVEEISAELRILPTRTKPTGGIEISCNLDENLTVGFHKGDLSTFPKPTFDPLNGGMAINVADTVAVPLYIQCLNCGISCCTLEVNGSEGSKKQPQTDCKITCTEEDAKEVLQEPVDIE